MKRPEPFPDLNWSEDRTEMFADETSALWAQYLRKLPGLPVAHDHTPEQVRRDLARVIPDDPMDNDDLFAHLSELVFGYSTQTGHGGFMGYISGAGTVPGGPASMLAAGINQNVGGWPLSPGATEIETQLLNWFAERLGMPDTTTGAFVTGGTTANLTALTVARDALADWKVRRDGVRGGPPMAVYASADAHDSIHRAADLLGLGSSAVRGIPVDDRFRMCPEAVEDAIEHDISAGVRPLCIVGTAGTTQLGAIDPLSALADLARRYDCWFHVDAAYGGSAAMVDDLKPLFSGIERADSVICDPHKWLNMPISSSIVLIRHPQHHLAAFTEEPDYLVVNDGVGEDMMWRYQWTPYFSRPFDALPTWVSLLAHGWSAYSRRISHDIELTRWLQHLISDNDELELLAEPELSVVCFRYVPPVLPDKVGSGTYLDGLNQGILHAVQRAGLVYPSHAVVRERYAIRACLISYRTEAEHVESLVDEVIAHGRRLHDA